MTSYHVAAFVALAIVVLALGASGLSVLVLRIAVALEALLEIERDRHVHEVCRRAWDVPVSERTLKAHEETATASVSLARAHLEALADQKRYRDEQREHMRVCAQRYEALVAGSGSSEEIKH